MKKLFRFSLWTLAAVVCLVALLALYLRNADLRVYEDEIEEYVSEKIGHDFSIDGRFELQVRGDITLTAEAVSITNPGWAADPGLLEVGHLSVIVDLWSLIDGPVIIRKLEVRDVDASLQRAGGATNWDTGRPKKDTPTQINTDIVAFRDVSISNVAFEYVNPERPRPINLLLEFLTVSPDENDILDLDLQGSLNEFPLWADGKLGPWQNFVDGRNLTADLDLTLGQVQLAVDGKAENFLRLEGVEATLRLAGPSVERVIDRLGLPPFATGPFQLDGELRRLDGGNQVNVSGNLGEIRVIANGFIDSLRRPRNTSYDFNLSGPDAMYISELLGVEGVPAVSYTVSGDFERHDRRLSFSGTRAQLGENTVDFDGWLEVGRDTTDVELAIDAQGPDFRVFAPFLGVENVPELAFDIAGRVRKGGDAWQFDDLVAQVGENRFSATGAMARGRDTEVTFAAAGPDNSFLHPLFNLEGLPARPYDVSATIRRERNGLRVKGLEANFGEHRIDIEGLVDVDNKGTGTELDLTLRGPDLRNIALLTRVPYLPNGPYYADGTIRLSQSQLDLNDMVLVVDDLRAQATGSVGVGTNSGDFDLGVKLTSPDIAAFEAFEWSQRLAGDSVSVEGQLRRDDEDIEVQALVISLGDVGANVDGKLSMEPLSNDSDLAFQVTGPDLGHLVSALGLDIFFPSRPFEISGQFNGTPKGFAMQNFVARVGDNDINGEFAAALDGKPTLTGSLSSVYLDLSDRLREASAAEPDETSEEEGWFFSDEPIGTGWLQAANVYFSLTVDTLIANQASVTEVELGFELRDGVLSLVPVSFRDVDGSFEATLQLVPQDGGYELAALLLADNVRLGTLGSVDSDRVQRPPLDGQVEFRGVGRSLHEIMASANGRVSLRQGRGQIPNRNARIFGDLVLEVIRALNPLRSKEKYRRLDCGIYEVSIEDGVAKLDEIAIQTDHVTTLATGKVNLATEKIDVGVRAKPREGIGVSLAGLTTSFIKIGGTLSAPQLTLDTKGTATTAGVAVATGGISLLAKGLADRLSGAVDICEQRKPRDEN